MMRRMFGVVVSVVFRRLGIVVVLVVRVGVMVVMMDVVSKWKPWW